MRQAIRPLATEARSGGIHGDIGPWRAWACGLNTYIRGPGWDAQVQMASVIRSDAAAQGHQIRYCRPDTPDRLDHQTLVLRPAHRLATASGLGLLNITVAEPW
jgi:hypothetical protein